MLKFDEDRLLCPNCGTWHVHLEDVYVGGRIREEGGPVVPVHVNLQGQVKQGDDVTLPREPEYRQIVTLAGWCEQCNVPTEISFTQSKGHTLIHTNRTPLPNGQHPRYGEYEPPESVEGLDSATIPKMDAVLWASAHRLAQITEDSQSADGSWEVEATLGGEDDSLPMTRWWAQSDDGTNFRFGFESSTRVNEPDAAAENHMRKMPVELRANAMVGDLLDIIEQLQTALGEAIDSRHQPS